MMQPFVVVVITTVARSFAACLLNAQYSIVVKLTMLTVVACMREHNSRNHMLWHCRVVVWSRIMSVARPKEKLAVDEDGDENNKKKRKTNGKLIKFEAEKKSNEQQHWRKILLLQYYFLLFKFFCLWQQFLINLLWSLVFGIIRSLFIVKVKSLWKHKNFCEIFSISNFRPNKNLTKFRCE